MAGAMPYFQILGAATEGLPLIGTTAKAAAKEAKFGPSLFGPNPFRSMIRGGVEGYLAGKAGLFGDMTDTGAAVTGAVTPLVMGPLSYPLRKGMTMFSNILAKAAAKKAAGTVAESAAKPVEAATGPQFSDLLRGVAGLPKRRLEPRQPLRQRSLQRMNKPCKPPKENALSTMELSQHLYNLPTQVLRSTLLRLSLPSQAI